MEKKNMLQNHSVEDKGAYLTVTLGDDEIVVTPKHLDTMNELCEYLDCLNLLIALVSGQSDCILKQCEKIEKLEAENDELNKKISNLETCNKETANEAIIYINENTELNDKIAKLGSEKNELFCKMEAFKDANARLGEQVKHLKATVKCLEDANDFNEQCRKMHLDAVKKDLDEAIAEKRVMAVKIDELQIRVNNQESLIKRIRAVAERNAKDGFETARTLVEIKKNLRDVHDWIEMVVDTEDDE